MAPDAAQSHGSSTRSRRSVGGTVLDLRSVLSNGLDRLGIATSSTQIDALLAYLVLLGKWGKVYNLTAVLDPDDMAVVHLLDSLAILPLVDRIGAASMLDVGSGAGLPAIPLAILRPGLDIVSIDAVAKKIGFQIQVRSALGLARLRPIHGRVETYRPGAAPSLIVSRAFATLGTMLDSIDHLSNSATTILAMKGTRPDAEIAALSTAWVVDDVIPLDVPFLGAERCAVLMRRSAP